MSPEHPHEEVEFDHLIRLLADEDGSLGLEQARVVTAAKQNHEAYVGRKYERPGCFAYVGWVKPPSPAAQFLVQGAFARVACAHEVFVGALEPNEGFGLAVWRKTESRLEHAVKEAYLAMTATIAHAAHLLRRHRRRTLWSRTRVVVGCGRLRGLAVFAKSAPRHAVLDGPRAVASLYGELPNRCGGIAKGKDLLVKHDTQARRVGGLNRHFLYRQAWTHFYLSGVSGGLWPVPAPVPHTLLTVETVQPEPLSASAARAHLVALSFDFSNSSEEFSRNANLAREVINRILSDFEALVASQDRLHDVALKDRWYVSPRYGDGLAAVIVVDAADAAAAWHASWRSVFRAFCRKAGRQLGRCDRLGLRVAIAVELDEAASAVRLAGVGHRPSAAVEPLAQQVVDRARRCHPVSKRQNPPIRVQRTVQWICETFGAVRRVELIPYLAGNILPVEPPRKDLY